MWANGERNKASIMKAVGVSRKTLLKYLKQINVQQTIPLENAKMAQELRSIQMQQPVQDTQPPEQLAYETHQSREWTWEDVDEYTRPDPDLDPVYDYRFDFPDPPPWEQQQHETQFPYYQNPEEDPHNRWMSYELKEIEEKLNKWKEEDRRKSEEILCDRKIQQSQIKNEELDTQNLQLKKQDIKSDSDKPTPVIERDKPIQSHVDSISPNPKETKNQDISTDFTPTTIIKQIKPGGKHQFTKENPDEMIPTIKKRKNKLEEHFKKTTIKENPNLDIATSMHSNNNLQEKQNTKVTSTVTLKEIAPIEEKEETEQDYIEIPILPVVNFLVDISTRLIRSNWDNKQIKTQPFEQRDNKDLKNYQYASISKSIMLQQLKKEADKTHV
jgi:hypothetical protein